EGQVAPAPATAAAALERAATAATGKPAPEPFPRPDQFFYTRTQATYLDTAVAKGGITVPSLDTRTREAWISLGRRGGERTIATKQRFPSAAARAAWVKAGRFEIGGWHSKRMMSLGKTAYYLGNERLSYVQLLAFNQSGPVLYQRLRDHYIKGQGGGIDDEVFTQIGDALREQASPPRLRAALYRALKEVPGVRYLGRVHDRLGRPAIGIGRTTNRGTRRELLFDPHTSAMLAEREVMVAVPKAYVGLVPSGTVMADAVYERRAVVDRLGQRP
ncbi:MAG: CU044_5270 family protein, partial [Baekduia sp.]